MEAYVAYEEGDVYAARWSSEEDDFVPVRRSGVIARNAGGIVTFGVPRSFLGDVAAFDFYFVSGDSSDDEDNAIDLAPDGDRWWRYTLANTPPLHLFADEARGIPTRPRAGRAFSVVVPVRKSDTARAITSGSATCTVRVAGKPVRAAGKVSAGTGRCSLRVPAGVGGATLRGSLVVRSAGRSVTTRFSFPVR